MASLAAMNLSEDVCRYRNMFLGVIMGYIIILIIFDFDGGYGILILKYRTKTWYGCLVQVVCILMRQKQMIIADWESLKNYQPCVSLQKHNTSIHSSPFYKQYLYFVLLYHCTLKYEINYYNFYVLPPIYSYGQYKFFALNKVVARPI